MLRILLYPFWWLFSEEAQNEWWSKNHCKLSALSHWNDGPFGAFLNRRSSWTLLFVHLVVCSQIAATGIEKLEPMLINWFWSPLIALYFYPFKSAEWPTNSFALLLRRYPNFFFWLNWAIGGILIPLCFWKFFVELDIGVGQPFRRWAGFGSQSVLFIWLSTVIGLIAAWREYSLYQDWRAERAAEARKREEDKRKADAYKAFKLEEDALWQQELQRHLQLAKQNPGLLRDDTTLFGEAPSPLAPKQTQLKPSDPADTQVKTGLEAGQQDKKD